MIDRNWTLFLDRDGVLNKRIVEGYVTKWDEFIWLPDVPEALKSLSEIFGTIIVVSNQQGVGKGIMTHEQVMKIHDNLMNKVRKSGGRIDAIYYSPHLSNEGSFLRKPNVGMGLKARKEFSAIRFSQSVMVGDSLSDMLFGHRLGMKTVFLSENSSDLRKGFKIIDFTFPDLSSFATTLTNSPTHLLTT
ncbi:MAG: HAD family hydrolase [Bacteroidales bacterium]|nr:HAD family hydrolase [Bacteroidales bacterium]